MISPLDLCLVSGALLWYFSPSFFGVICYKYVVYNVERDDEEVKLLGIELVVAVLFWPVFILLMLVKMLLVFLKNLPIFLFEKSKSLLKWLFTRH